MVTGEEKGTGKKGSWKEEAGRKRRGRKNRKINRIRLKKKDMCQITYNCCLMMYDVMAKIIQTVIVFQSRWTFSERSITSGHRRQRISIFNSPFLLNVLYYLISACEIRRQKLLFISLFVKLNLFTSR